MSLPLEVQALLRGRASLRIWRTLGLLQWVFDANNGRMFVLLMEDHSGLSHTSEKSYL